MQQCLSFWNKNSLVSEVQWIQKNECVIGVNLNSPVRKMKFVTLKVSCWTTPHLCFIPFLFFQKQKVYFFLSVLAWTLLKNIILIWISWDVYGLKFLIMLNKSQEINVNSFFWDPLLLFPYNLKFTLSFQDQMIFIISTNSLTQVSKPELPVNIDFKLFWQHKTLK